MTYNLDIVEINKLTLHPATNYIAVGTKLHCCRQQTDIAVRKELHRCRNNLALLSATN
jgi:hypothetical protein